MGQSHTTLESSTINQTPSDLFVDYVLQSARTLKPGDIIDLPIPDVAKDLTIAAIEKQIKEVELGIPMGVTATLANQKIRLARLSTYVDIKQDRSLFTMQLCRQDMIFNLQIDTTNTAKKAEWVNFLHMVDNDKDDSLVITKAPPMALTHKNGQFTVYHPGAMHCVVTFPAASAKSYFRQISDAVTETSSASLWSKLTAKSEPKSEIEPEPEPEPEPETELATKLETE